MRCTSRAFLAECRPASDEARHHDFEDPQQPISGVIGISDAIGREKFANDDEFHMAPAAVCAKFKHLLTLTCSHPVTLSEMESVCFAKIDEVGPSDPLTRSKL